MSMRRSMRRSVLAIGPMALAWLCAAEAASLFADELPIAAVEASADDGNVAANTIAGDLAGEGPRSPAVTAMPRAGAATDWPDATNTGVPPSTRLTPIDGDLTIDTPNTVVDAKEIRGCVMVRAPGVVIRRSRVSCAGFITIASFGGAYTGTGLLVEDTEIDCRGTSGTAVGDTNITVRRANIHGCENGFDVDGTVTIEDSYIHDLFNSDEAHTDGIQITPLGHDVTIRHNTIYSNSGTSAIITPRISAGIASDILVENNLLAGGAFTLYCPQDGSGINYRVIDNHFSTVFFPTVGAFGPWTDCHDEAEVRGNVYHETGQPVPLF